MSDKSEPSERTIQRYHKKIGNVPVRGYVTDADVVYVNAALRRGADKLAEYMKGKAK